MTSLKIISKFTLMLPFMITALSLSASAGMQFRVNPTVPKNSDSVRLSFISSELLVSSGFITNGSHHIANSHIVVNLISSRWDGVVIQPMLPLVGNVEIGKLMPGRYTVTAYWYQSHLVGFAPTLREVGHFDFVVGFGETVSAVIKPAIQLVFPTEAGKVYQIYRSEDLDAWLPHGEVIVGDGNASRYHEATDGVRGFFQVVEVPQAAP